MSDRSQASRRLFVTVGEASVAALPYGFAASGLALGIGGLVTETPLTAACGAVAGVASGMLATARTSFYKKQVESLRERLRTQRAQSDAAATELRARVSALEISVWEHRTLAMATDAVNAPVAGATFTLPAASTGQFPVVPVAPVEAVEVDTVEVEAAEVDTVEVEAAAVEAVGVEAGKAEAVEVEVEAVEAVEVEVEVEAAEVETVEVAEVAVVDPDATPPRGMPAPMPTPPALEALAAVAARVAEAEAGLQAAAEPAVEQSVENEQAVEHEQAVEQDETLRPSETPAPVFIDTRHEALPGHRLAQAAARIMVPKRVLDAAVATTGGLSLAEITASADRRVAHTTVTEAVTRASRAGRGRAALPSAAASAESAESAERSAELEAAEAVAAG